MGVPDVDCQSTGGTVADGGSPLLSAEAANTGLSDWGETLNFQPPGDLMSEMVVRFNSTAQTSLYLQKGYQPIEYGLGDCNMDCYLVDILTPPPTLNGGAFSPEALLTHIRTHLNDFLDPTCVWNEPLNDTEKSLWQSGSPRGALHRFYMGGKTNDPGQHMADACVVCTDSASDHWIFSTLQVPVVPNLPWPAAGTLSVNGTHPVNGNRRFGVGVRKAGEKWSSRYKDRIPVRDQDTIFFYTRGVDRCSNGVFQAMSSTVFGGGHACWMGLQKKIAHFLEGQGATVEFAGLYISERYPWGEYVAAPGNNLWAHPIPSNPEPPSGGARRGTT
jgi:hypothetical protein